MLPEGGTSLERGMTPTIRKGFMGYGIRRKYGEVVVALRHGNMPKDVIGHLIVLFIFFSWMDSNSRWNNQRRYCGGSRVT